MASGTGFGIRASKRGVADGGVATPPPGPGNSLLALLPPDALSRLATHVERVTFARKDVLFRAREPLRAVYFPITAVVSLVATLDSGSELEVGQIGRDGLAGTAVLPGVETMPCDGVVQIPGTMYRVNADALRGEMLADPLVQTVITAYTHLLLGRSIQLLLCTAFHPVEQRCVRWLLTVSDLIDAQEIPLTHDLLATMLGVRRPTVTLVIRSLRRAGLVDEKRARVTIRDRAGLEAACCECYGAMRTMSALNEAETFLR